MIRRLWLRWHAYRHPDHVLVGWDGTYLRCGTCLGLRHPENGMPRSALPRRHPARKAHPMTCDHEAQIRDLLEEREELLTEIRRLRMGRHPAGRALEREQIAVVRQLRMVADAVSVTPADVLALREALTERDAEHEGGGGA